MKKTVENKFEVAGEKECNRLEMWEKLIKKRISEEMRLYILHLNA